MAFSRLGKDVENFKAWQYSVDMEICNIQYRLQQLTRALTQLQTTTGHCTTEPCG